MIKISADRPSFNPREDLYGHAPFAESLANSICRHPDSDGLVFALYGPWGSGKSTVLNYVRHYLEQRPENDRPVVVEFNPWWFSGQENLARAFLGQLHTVLPTKSEQFKQLGDMFANYGEGIGGLTDLAGVTDGFGGPIGRLVRKWRFKPKDVPALKESITSVLQNAGKRILVVIDDIDRLTPEETRQLFTVIKGLADFPNVVYFLAFDREVAAQAIEHQVGLPGDRFLEKIVQVPFEIPKVDRVALRAVLLKCIAEVLIEGPDELFDQMYWTNVYNDGIDPLIQVPRDVVRLTNTLTVTYPSVRGEVNPVDFLALETLRVFLPDLYDVIRTNPGQFSGHSQDHPFEGTRDAFRAFHDKWMNEIPEERRASTRAMLERIFPKIGQIGYGPEWRAQWRRNLRVCHPDLFPIYFRLTIPPGNVRRSEIEALLSQAGTPAEFGGALVQAKYEIRPDGLSKAQALLDRLIDHVEKDIADAHIQSVIQSLLNVGDELIDPADKFAKINFENVGYVSYPVYHLLKRVGADQRAEVLGSAIRSGNAIVVQLWFLWTLEDEVKEANDSGSPTLLGSDEVERLKSQWLNRVRTLSGESNFLKHPELSSLLKGWREWAGEAEVRKWCDRNLESDVGLLSFLTGFPRYSSSQSVGDWAARIQPHINLNELEDYLDTASCADRLLELQQKGEVPDFAQDAVSLYLKAFKMPRKGKNPSDADD